jgi:hypothetical protein
MGTLATSHLSASSVTPQLSGKRYARSYWPRRKQAYSYQMLTGQDEDQELLELHDLSQRLEGQAGAIWVRHPQSRTWRGLPAWPTVGDGSTKAFAIPFHEHGGTPVLLKDEGSGQRHITLSYYADRANLIVDDDEAAMLEGLGSISGVNLGGGSVTASALHAYYGTQSAMVTPNGSQTGYGLQTSQQTSGIAAGRQYTGFAWVKGSISGFRARIYWYDSGGSPCTPAYSESGADVTTDWNWTPVSVSGTASTNAARAAVQIFYNGTSDAIFWADCIGLTDLESPYWWLPSMAPGVGVVASAPAADAAMESAGTGNVIMRCEVDSDEWADVVDGIGNQQSRLDFVEIFGDWE